MSDNLVINSCQFLFHPAVVIARRVHFPTIAKHPGRIAQHPVREQSRVSYSDSIRSRRPCDLPGRRHRVSFSKMPSAFLGAARDGIRSSQKSNIFYSKVLRKNTANAPAGGVEPQSNPARTAVNRAKKSFFLAEHSEAYPVDPGRVAEDQVLHDYAFNSVWAWEGIRSRRHQVSFSKMPSALLGAARDSIRSSQKSNIFYSKLMIKIVEGGFDLDSFRLYAALSLRLSGEAATRRPLPRRRTS
jgi:hypothetical protein